MTKASARHDSSSKCDGGSCARPGSDADTCPESGTNGSRVELVTVKALLRSSALRRLEGTNYHFCAAPDCDVVYFDNAVDSHFRKADLLVPVREKESKEPLLVCYCFEFTVADLRRDLMARGETDIPETITLEIQAGHCACEVKNPEGSCCLGNVRDAVKRIRADIDASPTSSQKGKVRRRRGFDSRRLQHPSIVPS